MEITLNKKLNINVVSNTEHVAVQTALKVISDNASGKNIQDSKNQMIQDLFEAGFNVNSPDGTIKIQSKLLQQVFWRMASRMKPLDFMMHGTDRPEAVEKIMTDGMSTVLDKGNYISSLRDKGGAFMNLLLYGDAFIQVGTDDSEYPIRFNSIDNSNFYTDTLSTKIRGGNGRECRQAVVIFSHSWSEVVAMFPKFKDKMGSGRIPRDIGTGKETERTLNQTTTDEGDLTEVAYLYDINANNYTIFVGEQCTVVEEHKGENYPFMLYGKAYIPVIQFIGTPSTKGFYNHGIGDMIYDIAVMSRKLFNMGLGHAEEGAFPITHVNIPKNKTSIYFRKLAAAYEMRKQGKKGFVAMEYDPAAPNNERVSAETLLTASQLQEWQVLWDNLTRELSRMGINIDEVSTQGQVTATQILKEEAAQNAFIKQIMEWNASETEKLVEITIENIKEFISINNKTPLDLTTQIKLENGTLRRADNITMGMISEEFKNYHYFVRVNSRSGVIPSNLFQQAQIRNILPTLVPGSPSYNKQVLKLSQLNDVDISMEDLQPAMQPQQQAALGDMDQSMMMSGTDRESIRPGELKPAI